MSEKVVRNFEDIFSACPKGVSGLVKQALKRYAKTKRGKSRLSLFLTCQGFVVKEGHVRKLEEYDEVMYDGRFEIFSCQHIAGDFVPMSVMFIEIDYNRVKISISSQWKYFHKDE